MVGPLCGRISPRIVRRGVVAPIVSPRCRPTSRTAACRFVGSSGTPSIQWMDLLFVPALDRFQVPDAASGKRVDVLLADLGARGRAPKLIRASRPRSAIVAVHTDAAGIERIRKWYPRVVKERSNRFWVQLQPERVPPILVVGAISLPCDAGSKSATLALSTPRAAPSAAEPHQVRPKGSAKCGCRAVGAADTDGWAGLYGLLVCGALLERRR